MARISAPKENTMAPPPASEASSRPAVIIFIEKTLPGGHRVARPLGAALIAGGLAMLAMPWLGGVP
jgi:hypothetical protein